MKKALVYILLATHIFFTGNIGIFLNLFSTPRVNATTTSVLYAGTAANLPTSTFNWVNPTNATGDTTATFARVTMNANPSTSNTLALTNFNFAAAGIPVGANITGVRVEVEWNGSNASVTDLNVSLTKNGTTAIGTNLGLGTSQVTKALRTYGGLTNLWGTTWTRAEVTATNFGVLLQYRKTGGGTRTASVYRARITIEHNSAPTDITLSGNTIQEGLPIGTTIGALTSSDIDIGNTHTYSLACTVPGADDSSFTLAGANLNSNAVFNYLTQSLYNICIRTTDQNGATFDKNFIVNISPIPTPGGVGAGLSLWLRADKGTSTSVDGATLATWNDQSTAGLDATAVTAPIYRNSTGNQLNFNPIVDFDGTTQYMQNLANGANSDSYFMVIIPDNTIDGTLTGNVPFGIDCLSGVLSSGTCGLAFAGMTLGAFTLSIADEVITHAIGSSANWRSAQTGVASYVAGKPMLLMANENAGASGTDIYEKGVKIDTTTRNTYQTIANADYSIGRSLDAANPFWYNGKIAEVINFSGRVGDAERVKIESYLSLKYGITLKSGTQNYIASDGSTLMWSTSTAGTYINSIFGIGRDDKQSLSQIKSKSINDDAVITLEALTEGTNIAPSFVDIGNKEFLSISDDMGGNTWTVANSPAGYFRLSREWRTQETGDVGTVQLDFDVADSDFDIPAPALGVSYYFLYDSNNNNSLSDEVPNVMTNVSGSIWRISGINLSNAQEFTIASQASVNNIPTNISLSSSNINENVGTGTTVGTFSTSDIDVLDVHSYSLVAGVGSTHNGSFSIVGNQLKILEIPDYEIQNSYNIRIQTDDGNGGQYQKAFTITISDLGEVLTSVLDFETPGKYSVTSGSWTRTSTLPYEGLRSIESNNAGAANSQSCFEVSHTFTSTGGVDFYRNVSSDTTDFLQFYIDNVQQGAGWSGTVPWAQYVSGDIGAGTHIYKWCYIKDGATNAGTDNAFVDYITFPNRAGDIVAPTISSISFASGVLLPGGVHPLIINYSDTGSAINTGSANIELYKWDGVSSWGANIAATKINTGSITGSAANYTTSALSFGKYRYEFFISDNAGNTSSTGATFYIDQPELTISTGSIDIGSVNSFGNSFSPTVTVTVKTVGAGFNVIMNRTSSFFYSSENIASWNGLTGYGYDQSPYSSNISTIGTNQNIATQGISLNTNGLQNTYTYSIKIGALTDINQLAGDYLGNMSFGINLTY